MQLNVVKKFWPAIKVVEKLNVKCCAVAFTYLASGLHERSHIYVAVCGCVNVHFKFIHLRTCVRVCYPVYSHLFIITYACACSGVVRFDFGFGSEFLSLD